MPAGITLTGNTTSQGTYNAATGLWTIGTLNDGAVATITLTGTVDAGQGGNTITNTTTAATGDQPDPSTAGDELDEAVVVDNPAAPSANLVTVKTLASADATPAEGDTVTFQIVVTNDGSDTATNVSLTDSLPAGITLTGNTTSQGTYNAATGLWTIGTLNDGAVATLTLTGTVDAGQGGNTITNTTTAAIGDQPDPSTLGDDLDEAVVVVNVTTTAPAINVTKLGLAAVPATSGTSDNYDVTYQLVVENVGASPLDNLTLTEDFAAQFGGAFIGIVGTPTITASTGAVAPNLNAAYDGAASTNIFDGTSGQIDTGDTITVLVEVELDPDNPTAIYNANNELENQVTATGEDPTNTIVSDLSDDPTNPTNADGNPLDPSDDDGNPDDPSVLRLPSVNTDKTVATFGAATSGTPGNFDVTYDITITNTGNDPLNNLSLTDNFAAQFGNAFVGIVGTPTVVAGAGAIAPTLNGAFDGGTTNAEVFNLASGEIETGESITVTIVAEVDPDAVGAVTDGSGNLVNQAIGGGDEPTGDLITDPSDDPTDPTNVDGNPLDPTDDNNNPDDPTVLILPPVPTTGSDVSGSVYFDANGNGIRDTDETGIIGVEIILTGTDINGNPVNISVLSNANGDYTFPNVQPGDYTITQVQPPAFIDGQDSIGSLGGTQTNDSFSFTLTPGSADGFDYNFGEAGLQPAALSKALLLSSTPADYWENLDATASGTQGLWVPFEATSSGAVQAILIDAESIDVDIFDENMNLLNPAQEGDAGGTWVVREGQRYFVRLRGDDSNFDFELAFGADANLPVTLDMSDNVVIAAGTQGDDNIELILGAQTHLLTMAGYTFEFDASVIDTIRIGASSGNDTITVVGTELDDEGYVLDNYGRLTSSAYEVHTYSFDTVIFEGNGGDDYTQIFGSDGDDELQAIPQNSTLTTPTHTMQMLGFERVDSYGRHGNDYAAMYGTQGDDQYLTFDTFEVLQGENMKMRTIGWDRVDAFGRGGNDTAHVYDTAGDDHLYVFPEFSVMQSDHLYAVVKDFEQINADMKNGGNDKVYFRQIATAEHVFANGNIATLTGPERSIWVWNHDQLEIDVNANENPSQDLRNTEFVVQK